jgi:hypothetical protein
VVILWAGNPVAASYLLRHEGIAVMSLSVVRLLTFSLFSIIFFVGWTLVSRRKYELLRPTPFISILPAGINALLMFATYGAILVIPPALHLTILRFNTFLFQSKSDSRSERAWSYVGMSLLLVSLLVFSFFLPQYRWAGLILSAVALVLYTLYSWSTERIIQTYRIGLRYPILSLWMGIWLGLLGLILFVTTDMSSLTLTHTFYAALYTVLFVCVPYTSYSALLKSVKFRYFTDVLLLEVPIAFVSEWLIFGDIEQPIIYWLIFGTLAAIVLIRVISGKLSLALDSLSR